MKLVFSAKTMSETESQTQRAGLEIGDYQVYSSEDQDSNMNGKTKSSLLVHVRIRYDLQRVRFQYFHQKILLVL